MKRFLIPVITVVLVAGAMIFQSIAPETTVCEPPKIELKPIPGFTDEPIAQSEKETDTLPKDTVIQKRLYKSALGEWHQVTVVIGGTSKSSLHRPELCLPSQGYLMVNPHTTTIADLPWHFITLEMRNGSVGFGYTFLNQTGFHTATHAARIWLDIWDRSLYNRIDRWAMITVVSSSSDDEANTWFFTQLKGMIP